MKKMFFTLLYLLTIATLNAQNVGIGVTNPEFKLDVGGRLRVRSGGDANSSAGVWLNDIANSTTAAFVGMMTNNQVGIFGTAVGNFGFNMNTSNGFVGIGLGNFDPSSRLDVRGSVKANDYAVTSGTFDMATEYIKLTLIVPSFARYELNCDCPSGKKAIGGGGGQDVNVAGGEYIIVNSTRPYENGLGWRVIVSNRDPAGQHLIEVWAICAKIK